MDTAKQVADARGNEAAFTQLVKEHKRFILASAYRATGRFVTESDDEWSVALIAFHEAVKTYAEDKGDFHAFAALVIKRRLLDHLRAGHRHDAEIDVSPEILDGDVEDETEETAIGLAVRKREAALSEEAAQGMAPGANNLRDEIEAVQGLLKEYGFSFFDLTDCSPKAEKTKNACAKAVCALLTDAELLARMRTKKTLPMKELEKLSKVPRKILERHRKYIIAATEILNGEYPLLADYMWYIRKQLIT